MVLSLHAEVRLTSCYQFFQDAWTVSISRANLFRISLISHLLSPATRLDTQLYNVVNFSFKKLDFTILFKVMTYLWRARQALFKNKVAGVRNRKRAPWCWLKSLFRAFSRGFINLTDSANSARVSKEFKFGKAQLLLLPSRTPSQSLQKHINRPHEWLLKLWMAIKILIRSVVGLQCVEPVVVGL